LLPTVNRQARRTFRKYRKLQGRALLRQKDPRSAITVKFCITAGATSIFAHLECPCDAFRHMNICPSNPDSPLQQKTTLSPSKPIS
jgi:hypothetical protein